MERLPQLRLLTTFDTVHRLGSMQLAAAELNVTRPAVTQALKTLEAEIGVALFDRGAKPARPTDAGERLARATRAGLGQIAAAIEDIRASAGAAERQVTVSCTLGMATHWLMPRLPGFYARFPETVVNVQAPPSDLPTFSAGIDVALRYGPGPPMDGETRKLFDECAVPVGRPGVIAQFDGDPSALVEAPLIHVQASEAHRWPGWSDYAAAMGIARPLGRRQTFDNYVQATQAALNGQGILLGWHSITHALVEDGRLDAHWLGSFDFGTAYWAIYRDGTLHRPAVREFFDWVEEEGRHFELSTGDRGRK